MPVQVEIVVFSLNSPSGISFSEVHFSKAYMKVVDGAFSPLNASGAMLSRLVQPLNRYDSVLVLVVAPNIRAGTAFSITQFWKHLVSVVTSVFFMNIPSGIVSRAEQSMKAWSKVDALASPSNMPAGMAFSAGHFENRRSHLTAAVLSPKSTPTCWRAVQPSKALE